jgi:Spy/CpxP family protein refolding chaperone
MKRKVILTAALVALVATSAAAQGPGRDGPAGRRLSGRAVGDAGPRSMRLYDPGSLLRRQSALSLTDEQVQQLSRLNQEAVTTREQARIAYVSQRAQLAEVLAVSEPNMQEARAHFDSAQVAMSRLQWMSISNAVRAKTVLTEEQQAAVRELRTRSARGTPGRAPRGRRR